MSKQGDEELAEQQALIPDGFTPSEGCIDDYEVLKPIGRGKFSTVFRAIKRDTGQVVALKRVQLGEIIDEKKRAKTLKEVKLLQSLTHPNIIKYLDSFLTEDDLIIVFEWAEAGDLKRQIRKAQQRELRFEERTIWRYFQQVAEALRFMHTRRVMHRDLKPANIFLTADAQVKVGDLGLSRQFSEHTLQAYSKVGTPLYMSPEVLHGKGYEWRSDVWSLGCILYELAMLRSPFKEQGLNLYGLFQKINKGEFPPIPDDYSADLRHLVSSMVATDVRRRPSMEQVCQVAGTMRERTRQQRHRPPPPLPPPGGDQQRPNGSAEQGRDGGGRGKANEDSGDGARPERPPPPPSDQQQQQQQRLREHQQQQADKQQARQAQEREEQERVRESEQQQQQQQRRQRRQRDGESDGRAEGKEAFPASSPLHPPRSQRPSQPPALEPNQQQQPSDGGDDDDGTDAVPARARAASRRGRREHAEDYSRTAGGKPPPPSAAEDYSRTAGGNARPGSAAENSVRAVDTAVPTAATDTATSAAAWEELCGVPPGTSPLVALRTVHDRLLLLRWPRLPPVWPTPWHFVAPAEGGGGANASQNRRMGRGPHMTRREQQLAFFALAGCLLEAAGLTAPRELADDDALSEAAPHALASQLLWALSQAGMPAPSASSGVHATAVSSAYGSSAAAVLGWLTQRALQAQGTQLEEPVYPAAVQGGEEEEEGTDGIADDDEEEGAVVEEEGEEEEALFVFERNEEEAAAGGAGTLAPILRGTLDAREWGKELERVGPTLRSRQREAGRGVPATWRSRVDEAQTLEARVRSSLAGAERGLSAAARAAQEGLEAVAQREQALNATFARQCGDAAAVAARRREAEEQHRACAERVARLSDEVADAEEALQEARSAVDEQGKRVDDAGRLAEVKRALRQMRREVQELDLRMMVTRQQLLRLEAEDRAGLARRGDASVLGSSSSSESSLR